MKQVMFTDSFYYRKFPTKKNLHKKIKQVLKKEKQRKVKENRSNVKGFQTLQMRQGELVEEFRAMIKPMIAEELGFKDKKLAIANLWINENTGNSFNMPHVHPCSDFSGVYYVTAPKNSGDLYFIRNDIGLQMQDYGIKGINLKSETGYFYHVPPKKNVLLLFKSNLMHGVEANCSGKSRISVSFNIWLRC